MSAVLHSPAVGVSLHALLSTAAHTHTHTPDTVLRVRHKSRIFLTCIWCSWRSVIVLSFSQRARSIDPIFMQTSYYHIPGINRIIDASHLTYSDPVRERTILFDFGSLAKPLLYTYPLAGDTNLENHRPARRGVEEKYCRNRKKKIGNQHADKIMFRYVMNT